MRWSRHTRWELTWAELTIVAIVALGQLWVLVALVVLLID